jgi:hypothetical protein
MPAPTKALVPTHLLLAEAEEVLADGLLAGVAAEAGRTASLWVEQALARVGVDAVAQRAARLTQLVLQLRQQQQQRVAHRGDMLGSAIFVCANCRHLSSTGQHGTSNMLGVTSA